MKIIRLIILALSLTTLSYAKTPFILTGVKTLYPVVEIHTDIVGQKYVPIILKKLKSKVESLGISTKNYPQRFITILISSVSIADEPAVHVKLIIGEDVKRLDDNEEVFAITYSNDDIFEVFKLDEDIQDSVDFLLDEFAEQYKEDNE